MKKKTQISKVDLESLLNWLSPDSEEAGLEYEKIRKGLVRFFRYRGCSECDDLADETINRLAIKVDSLDLSTGVKKISIFYGFALNVFREYVRENVNVEVPIDAKFPFVSAEENDERELERELDCLDKCLNKLTKSEKDLITTYFSKERSEKIKLRKKMAEKLGITPNALHVRVYRVKNDVKKCIENCFKKKTL